MTRHGQRHRFGVEASSSFGGNNTLASSSLAPRAAAAPIAVTLSNNIQSCSPMTVTWDASKGHTPWTITVAPVNQLPVSVTIPTAPSSSSQLSWQWDVPNYSTALDVIVGVSDASGTYSGVSTFSKIATSSSSCAAPASGLDFVWYPKSEKAIPAECGTWTLQWQVDKANSGITPPVQFVVLGEGQQPMQYAAGIRDSSWDMPVALRSGTKFVVAAFDNGKSGTGGVGEEYTVGPRAAGTKCVANAAVMPSPGLIAAKTQATALAPSSSSSSSSSSSAAHKSAKSTNAAATPQTTNSTSNSNADASSSSSSSSHGGAIAGAVVGCLLAAALVVGLYIFWKRRKANGNGGGGRSGWPAADVMPWRWEVVDEDEKRRGGAATTTGGGGSTGGTFTVNHVRRASQTPGAGGVAGADTYASGTDSSVGHHMSKPSLSSRNIYSVVPDEALFPPPSSQQAHGNGETSSQRRQRDREMSAGSLERPPRPPVAKVVPDSMLFPPPAPSPAVGTPVGGVGAGVGTYAALNRSGERSWDNAGSNGNGMASPVVGAVVPRNMTTQQQQQQQQQYAQQYQQQRTEDSTPRSPPPARKASPPRYPAAPPSSSSFPVSTSIHDPYAHMSRIYNDPAMQARLASYSDAPSLPPQAPAQAQPQSQQPHRSASNSSAPRLPPLLYPGARGKADPGQGGGGLGVPQQLGRKASAASSKRSSLGSDVDASLPYL